MTITLIVVAGLVLEVVRLNRKLSNAIIQGNEDVEKLFYLINNLKYADQAQIHVNRHIAEDIAELQKKLKRKK